jgi:2-C-methyl-D-erythritol 4-phosphate cytidylyltransferase
MPGGQPRVDVLVLAAGRGERLGVGDKAFLHLGGMTLLERALAGCQVAGGPLFVAVPAGRVADAKALSPPGTAIIEGGPTRSATLRLPLTDRTHRWC